ncbi:hypothetical protein [uncultured Clostridium sp.]|uniref:hypothetical protein n=1 Tax=uncultured Clostridium sp. TaxID=59620 RepID=UPI002729FDE5|nr:hypothetical protein [uncultured Clostridium sp.]
MNIIVVDNEHIKQHFSQILKSTAAQQVKKIIIESKSGKGKTSLLKYFVQQCGTDIPCIYFDFKIEDFTSEFDFTDQIIYSLIKFYNEITFDSYESCLHNFFSLSNNEIIIKNVKVIQSSIGNITISNDITSRIIPKVAAAFWHDYKLALNDKKIVLLLDSFEQAPNIIHNWISRYLLKADLKDNQLYIIIAGQENAFSDYALDSDDIKKYILPDNYSLENWYKFGEQIHIIDKNYVDRCFNYYGGEPFNMCIALKPQGELNDR